MNNDLALRPVTSATSVRRQRAAVAARRLASKLVLAAAPMINLYWAVGVPPYDER